MKKCLALVGLAALLMVVPAAASAQLPVKLLSKARLGTFCRDTKNTNAALDCWLTKHPDVANAMVYIDSAGGGTWSQWPAATKTAFYQYFNDMVGWYATGAGPKYPKPFAAPIAVEDAGGAGADVWVAEPLGRTVCVSQMANNLAAELTAAFPWSITSYTADELALLLGGDNILGVYVVPLNAAKQGFYFWGGAGLTSPAPAGMIVNWMNRVHLVGTDAADTVARVFGWERVLRHFFFEPNDPNENQPSYPDEYFWGSSAPVIASVQLIQGTTYTGPSGPTSAHWTRGCTGTSQFMKSILQAVNIPVKIAYTCGHTLPTFPTAGVAMTHGDDPYNALGKVSPFPGFATPQLSEYLISLNDFAALFPVGGACLGKLGFKPLEIAVTYASDELMGTYCKDLKANATHANGQVFMSLRPGWPEMTDANFLTWLENGGLWTRLDAKIAATNYCAKY